MSAGTDWIEDHMPPQATLCNARGARDGPVAEWILGALLGASTGLLATAARRRWDRSRTVRTSARHRARRRHGLDRAVGWRAICEPLGTR